jgi:hypothetical protein
MTLRGIKVDDLHLKKFASSNGDKDSSMDLNEFLVENINIMKSQHNVEAKPKLVSLKSKK